MIMLNTDLHNPQIANKMSKGQFVSNNRGIGPNGADVDRAVLEGVYDSILAQEIKIEQREYIQGVAHEGWLMKQVCYAPPHCHCSRPNATHARGPMQRRDDAVAN